jgi:hypothetical protein
MSKHTPGPWRANHEDVLGPGNMTVAWCTTGFSYDHEADGYSISKVEAHANAHLIAAAPDMFNALQQYAIAERTKNPERLERARTARIRAMIKALGEQPSLEDQP